MGKAAGNTAERGNTPKGKDKTGCKKKLSEEEEFLTPRKGRSKSVDSDSVPKVQKTIRNTPKKPRKNLDLSQSLGKREKLVNQKLKKVRMMTLM